MLAVRSSLGHHAKNLPDWEKKNGQTDFCVGSPATLKETVYWSVGCFKDSMSSRALPTLEGEDDGLDGSYSSRANPVDKCYRAAKARGFRYFAVQSGGWCAAGNAGYEKYGPASNCAGGEGGGLANDVYTTVDPEPSYSDYAPNPEKDVYLGVFLEGGEPDVEACFNACSKFPSCHTFMMDHHSPVSPSETYGVGLVEHLHRLRRGRRGECWWRIRTSADLKYYRKDTTGRTDANEWRQWRLHFTWDASDEESKRWDFGRRMFEERKLKTADEMYKCRATGRSSCGTCGSLERLDVGVMDDFPAWIMDTTFTNSDPNADAQWVVDVAKYDQGEPEESDAGREGILLDIAGWALGSIGFTQLFSNPLLAMGLFALDRSLQYLAPDEPEEKENKYYIDLTNTINKLKDQLADNNDRKTLVEELTNIRLFSSLAISSIQNAKDDKSSSEAARTLDDSQKKLGEAYHLGFGGVKETLLQSSPQAAWYLFEPMFSSLVTRFEVYLLKVTAKLQQAKELGGKAGIDLCDDIRGNLIQYRAGNEKQGSKDPYSLVYQWELFLHYFNTAFNTREAAVTLENMQCTNKDSRINFEPYDGPAKSFGTTEGDWDVIRSFGASWSWKDDWTWAGEKQVSYDKTWEVSGTDKYSRWSTANSKYQDVRLTLPKGRQCNVKVTGNVKAEDAMRGGAEPHRASPLALGLNRYRKAIADKRVDLLEKFSALYYQMVKRTEDMEALTFKLGNALRNQSARKYSSQNDIQALHKNCVVAMAPKGSPERNDAYFWTEQLAFEKWGYDCGVEKNVRLGSWSRGKVAKENLKFIEGLTASRCMRSCQEGCGAWALQETSRIAKGWNGEPTVLGNCHLYPEGVELKRTIVRGWTSGTMEKHRFGGCQDLNHREFDVEVFRDTSETKFINTALADRAFSGPFQSVMQGKIKLIIPSWHGYTNDPSNNPQEGMPFDFDGWARHHDEVFKYDLRPMTRGVAVPAEVFPTGSHPTNTFEFKRGDLICPTVALSKEERAKRFAMLGKEEGYILCDLPEPPYKRGYPEFPESLNGHGPSAFCEERRRRNSEIQENQLNSASPSFAWVMALAISLLLTPVMIYICKAAHGCCNRKTESEVEEDLEDGRRPTDRD